MKRTNDYIPYIGRFADIVELDEGRKWYFYRGGEEDLPKQAAWCKHCSKLSAKPMMPIVLNNSDGYALRCPKCRGEFAIYKDRYIRMYVGTKTASGGRINPTYGKLSTKEAMDRRALDERNRRAKEIDKHICELSGYSSEEWGRIKAKHEEEIRRLLKDTTAKAEAHRKDEEIKNESEKRKELIAKGVLKYVKGIGLVNSETNQIVKL